MFRSEHVTVLRRKSDGSETCVFDDGIGEFRWCMTRRGAQRVFHHIRAEAESAARAALTRKGG